MGGGQSEKRGNEDNPNYPVNESKLLWLDSPVAGTPRSPGPCRRQPLSRLIQRTPSCLQRAKEGREGGSDSWRPQGLGDRVGTRGPSVPAPPAHARVSVASQRVCVPSGGDDGATPCHRPTDVPEGTLWLAEGPRPKSPSISPSVHPLTFGAGQLPVGRSASTTRCLRHDPICPSSANCDNPKCPQASQPFQAEGGLRKTELYRSWPWRLQVPGPGASTIGSWWGPSSGLQTAASSPDVMGGDRELSGLLCKDTNPIPKTPPPMPSPGL